MSPSFRRYALTTVFALGMLAPLQQVHAANYTITQGQHYATPRAFLAMFNGTTASYGFTFNQSAAYNLNGIDQLDINKLAGFSDCMALDPQTNSARIGWRWDLTNSPSRGVEILAYIDPNHQAQSLGYLPLGQKGYASISLLNKNTYQFKMKGGATVQMPRLCKSALYDKKMTGFKSSPYFGGNQVAPQAITIQMDESLPPSGY